ncbi:MAG TPA: prolyl-tRNA synthetase associated domain-containing protein [Candidatus Babeliales bacterium]|nr:prolyl-tRNA synthetase associated domain-containing protein [Candidatus Babeliales bacterium]
MMNIYIFLNNHNIAYESFDHPAVFTCEQAEKFCPKMPGKSIKNIFLYDKKTNQHFLIIVSTEKQIDLKKLKTILGASKLSFASEEDLQLYLGVTPGSVTILGLINDTTHTVTVIFDEILKDQTLQCHPLINTKTVTIPFDEIKKFLKITQHAYQFFDIPKR